MKKTKKTLSKTNEERKEIKIRYSRQGCSAAVARKKKEAINNVKHYQGYRKRGSINKQICVRKGGAFRKGGACKLEKKALLNVERKLEQQKKS